MLDFDPYECHVAALERYNTLTESSREMLGET